MVAVAAMTILGLAAPAMAGKTKPAPPPAPALPACGPNDITAPSLTVLACSGFKDGNLLSGSPADAITDKGILAALGYTGWDGKMADAAASVSGLKGSKDINFGVALTGISIIAVHYGAGNGSGGPGKESTAFYVLDAAQGINQIHLAYGASSNAVLFVTGLPRQIGTVPEPATWATMVGGFGVIGGQIRRRRRVTVTATA